MPWHQSFVKFRKDFRYKRESLLSVELKDECVVPRERVPRLDRVRMNADAASELQQAHYAASRRSCSGCTPAWLFARRRSQAIVSTQRANQP